MPSATAARAESVIRGESQSDRGSLECHRALLGPSRTSSSPALDQADTRTENQKLCASALQHRGWRRLASSLRGAWTVNNPGALSISAPVRCPCLEKDLRNGAFDFRELMILLSWAEGRAAR